MMRFVSALTLFVVLATSVQAADATSEQAKLAGAWTAVEAQRGGAAAQEDVGHRLEFRGDQFTISMNDKLIFSGTYSLNPSTQPAQIDFHHLRGDAHGKTWEGIYQLAGDTLTVCDDAFDPSQTRPRNFTTAPGSGHVLITFKRN
jgi:uncharacterized protein (TIGR03067 family)